MKIAFLGLGAMGNRMAARLLDAGHDLAVWNRSPGAAAELVDRGARLADSPRDAAAGATIVIAMLRDDDAAEHVWLDPESGALAGLMGDALAVECSTLGPVFVRKLAGRIQAAGGRFVDAPVLGSRPQADAGALIHLIGGDAADVARVEPVLAAFSAARHHVGPVGAGATLKLIANSLFAIQVAALAEWFPALGAGGMTPETALAALGETPVMSGAAKAAGGLMLSGRHPPMFPVDLVIKDLDYAQRLRDAALPITRAAQARYVAASVAGLGDAHLTAVAQL